MTPETPHPSVMIRSDGKVLCVTRTWASVRMDYQSLLLGIFGEGSGGWLSSQAYKDKFKYASAEDKNGDDMDFYDVLEENMKNAEPGQLGIFKKKEEKLEDGHSIVADGFKDTGEYHLNFGWGGSSDGWYFLPEGMPVGYNVVYIGIGRVDELTNSDV